MFSYFGFAFFSFAYVHVYGFMKPFLCNTNFLNSLVLVDDCKLFYLSKGFKDLTSLSDKANLEFLGRN